MMRSRAVSGAALAAQAELPLRRVPLLSEGTDELYDADVRRAAACRAADGDSEADPRRWILQEHRPRGCQGGVGTSAAEEPAETGVCTTAILVSSDGTEVHAVSAERSALIVEMCNATGMDRTAPSHQVDHEVPRIPLDFSAATVRRAAAVMTEGLNMATIDLWPQLTAEESAELVAACNFLMLAPSSPAGSPGSLDELQVVLSQPATGAVQRVLGAAAPMSAYAEAVRHNLGLVCEVSRSDDTLLDDMSTAGRRIELV